MLDRVSGKVIHIDFGDCFEVAMVREKFPEKIPFRLTRMLINAMEVRVIELGKHFVPIFLEIAFISSCINKIGKWILQLNDHIKK